VLALQQKTNQKLRDLEIANEESRSLLLRALLEKDNLSPELLQIKKEETLRQIREQIQGVIITPSEAQPKVLEVTSSEIAETVLKSQAALDMVKKVSIQQFRSNPEPFAVHMYRVAIESGPTSVEPSGSQSEVSQSAATLVPSPYKGKSKLKVYDKSSSDLSTSTTSTRKTSWGNRLASLMSPSASSLLAIGDKVRQPVPDLASLSCAVLLKSIFISVNFVSFISPHQITPVLVSWPAIGRH
jgi:protein HOOK3